MLVTRLPNDSCSYGPLSTRYKAANENFTASYQLLLILVRGVLSFLGGSVFIITSVEKAKKE
jgi:hypothetical protein